MTTDTGEPPSPGQHNASPGVSPYQTPAADKPWRPDSIGASFIHAIDGVRETFRAERNFRFHVFASILVLVAGFVLHLPPLRIVAVFFAVALVLVAELFNTALEAAVDLAMPEQHPLAKRAKDASAGAVLAAAICAAVIGGIVFVPALMPYVAKLPPSAFILPVLLLVAVLFAFLRKRGDGKVSGPSSDLSRKVVIGVALVAFAASGAYRFEASVTYALWSVQDRCAGGVLVPGQPILPFSPVTPFSAGVP